jgi:hypothetical protein
MKKLREKKYSIIKILAKYSFIFVIFFSVMMPFVVINAVKCSATITTNCEPEAGSYDRPEAGSSDINQTIKNPLQGGVDTLPQFIEAVINVVLVIGIPILTLAIIYAGFIYVKAQGNPGELEVAHRTLLYTVIGGALLLGAFVIANAIGKTVDDIKSST